MTILNLISDPDGKLVALTQKPKEEVTVPLPEDRMLAYLARDESGNFYVIDQPKDESRRGDFGLRAYIGPATAVQEVEIVDIEHLSDGGSAIIYFKKGEVEGELYFPSQMRVDEKPTVMIGDTTVTLEDLLQ